MKEEISQLVDSRGRRPASNNDAIKLYSYSASLPLYRRKYDWRIPAWCKESIKCLHNAVAKEVIAELGTGPGGLDERLGNLELPQAIKLFNAVPARNLYEAYISYGVSLMRDAIFMLLKCEESPTHVKRISEDPSNFATIFAEFVDRIEKEHMLSMPATPLSDRSDYDLGALWSRIAHQVNTKSKRLRNKLASECWTIFLNSTHDGEMICSISADDAAKVRDYMDKNKSNGSPQRFSDVAEKLGLTLYQVLKATSVPESSSRQRWDEKEDEKLLTIVQRQVNANVNGHKRNSAVCWKTVARQMGNKTNDQCRLRWRAIGNSTADCPFEDSQLYMLQILHAAYGENWQKIAKLIPGKLAHQCRTKFFSSLSQPERGEYLKYYKDLRNAISNHISSINVRKWWNRVDWLGNKLLRIASITKDSAIMRALDDFYGSEEIPKRIDIIFSDQPIKRAEPLHGFDVLTMAEYLMKYPSQMVTKMVNSAVSALLKKTRTVSANEFESIFEMGTIEEEEFLRALGSLLKAAWP